MCRLIYLHYSLSSGAMTSLLSNVKTYYGGGKESSRGTCVNTYALVVFADLCI